LSAAIVISPFAPEHRQAVLALSQAAWAPVFQILQPAVPEFVYGNFYPDGWLPRQMADISAFLDQEPDMAWIAQIGEKYVGWIGGRLHPEDNMGEIYILAVDPAAQRQGVAKALMAHLTRIMQDRGMKMVMVETGDDPGHAASRATYENAGFERWPVARYFRKI
jgi:ribosomal protein S18 acetylase RimI-like enzyme